MLYVTEKGNWDILDAWPTEATGHERTQEVQPSLPPRKESHGDEQQQQRDHQQVPPPNGGMTSLGTRLWKLSIDVQLLVSDKHAMMKTSTAFESLTVALRIRGLVGAYGGFESFYGTFLLPHNSASSLSWVGTLQGFFLVGGCIISGPLYDRGFLYTLLLVGSSLLVFGIMMLSLATAYYQIVLAQGVCVGMGSACLYAPALAVPATAFTSKRLFCSRTSDLRRSCRSVYCPKPSRYT